MKTISKNVLLFALLVCCNRTIKSADAAAATADQGINPAIMESWLIQLQEAQKNGIADKKDTNPEEYERLADLIESIEAAQYQRLVNSRVETLIKELSKQLGKKTEEDKKEQSLKLLRDQKREMLRSDLLGSDEDRDLIKQPSSFEFFRQLYLEKVLQHLNDRQFDLCTLSPEEQKAHVKSLREYQQRELRNSLQRPYEEDNQFFQGLRNLLPKAPDKSIHSYVDLPDETKQEICKPLNISSLRKLLDEALTPPGEVYKK